MGHLHVVCITLYMYNKYNCMYVYICIYMYMQLHHLYTKLATSLLVYTYMVNSLWCMFSVHDRHVLDNVSSMHQIECFLQYVLNCMCHASLFTVPPSPFPLPPCAGAVTTTTASLVALWIATVTVFGVVTAVLSWQSFKLKQKGMLGHMDDV